MANSIYRGAGLAIPLLRRTNQFVLQGGQVQLIPAGTWWISALDVSSVQQKDPVTGTWVNFAVGDTGIQVMSDGVNYRVANLTGAVLSTTITSAGSGYTAAPTVTSSAGGSTYTAIVGGAVGSIAVVSGGGSAVAGSSSYTFTPRVVIDAPPSPGIAATAYATMSGGTVTAITVSVAGAGYTAVPTVTVVPDPREPNAGGITAATATVTLSGAGTVTGLLIIYEGTPLGSAPTLTLSGNATATATINTTASTIENFYMQQV